MEHLLQKLVEALQNEISAFHPDYALEIKKEHDAFYAIGDNLDLVNYDNVFHGGIECSQFLLFVNIRKPYMIHISEWRNEEILPNQPFQEFITKQLQLIFNEHYGYIAFRKKYGGDKTTLLCNGKGFERSQTLAKEFRCSSYDMSPTADYQWFYKSGVAVFYVVLTEKGLKVRYHDDVYHQTLTTKEEIHDFITLVDEKINEIHLFKKRLVKNFSVSISEPGKITRSYKFFPEKLHITDCRLIIHQGQLQYYVTCNQESFYYSDTDALFERIKEMYTLMRTKPSIKFNKKK